MATNIVALISLGTQYVTISDNDMTQGSLTVDIWDDKNWCLQFKIELEAFEDVSIKITKC